MSISSENFKIQCFLTSLCIVIFLIKLSAFLLTNSVAILTDTLEYTVNIIGAFVGLYSLYLASKPSDLNHPYGHGKIEFISAAIEGMMMVIASLFMIVKAAYLLKSPSEISQLEWGIALFILSTIMNFIFGFYAMRKGEKNRSLALIATGKHMQSDSYTTLGILIGLFLLRYTQLSMIDSFTAIVFSCITLWAGYKILRDAIAGIMDEADHHLLKEFVEKLEAHRFPTWIDIHNLRIIKYGAKLHLDCHLTVPWYLNVHEAHLEIDRLTQFSKENFGDIIELFVHTDGCLPFSCAICHYADCQKRQHSFIKKIKWDFKNITCNTKHTLDTPTVNS